MGQNRSLVTEKNRETTEKEEETTSKNPPAPKFVNLTLADYIKDLSQHRLSKQLSIT